MSLEDVAAAMQRVETVLQRRPEVGLHDDVPATARWQGGLRFATGHANGMQVLTDMPEELGGGGEHVTPGWLFRAGLASCTATRIAMAAAAQGIELSLLELQVASRSDTRGLLGLPGADGEPVSAVPGDVALRVRIAAPGVAAERLHALVETGHRNSPVPCAVRQAVPIAVRVEVVGR